jgi:hypothetical protein
MRARSLSFAAVAACSSIAMAAPAGARSLPDEGARPEGVRVMVTSEHLTDLKPDVADPTDGASALALAVTGRRGTVVLLSVHGLDPAAAGRTLGAHVHVGPCVGGAGAAAGPHLSHQPPPSPSTEIWLDLAVGPRGSAFAAASVPFAVPPGSAGSIVIHAQPTAPDGTAGERLACLPFTM